jgi:sialate O-acetylesterase
LWYQGESNAGDRDAFVYRDQFRQMITGWRQDWGVGDFPFLYVQLANFMAPDSLPAESGWAMLRESQSAALTLPHTAQAVIIDLGEAEDIHPRNKQDVGLRLSLAARKVAYGEDLVWSGPVYRHHTVRTGQMVLTFDHVGSGLVAKGGVLQGFAIAGADRRFVWAQARLEGNTVVVWHEAIPDPQAVRYAWGNNPDKASLYNREGLPASPFRTDTW